MGSNAIVFLVQLFIILGAVPINRIGDVLLQYASAQALTDSPTVSSTLTPTYVANHPTPNPSLAPTYLANNPTPLPTYAPSSKPTAKPTATPQPTKAGLSSDPVVISWNLLLGYGYIEIIFDQIIKPESFKASRVSIISNRTNSYPYDTAVYLTGYDTESFMNRDKEPCDGISLITDCYDATNTSRVYFYLLADDYAPLMYNPSTANTRENSWIVVRQGAITTFDGRPNKEVNQANAIQATIVVADTVQPSFVAGGLDYDTGYLTLRFSEPIGQSGVANGVITLDGLAIQSAANCVQYGGKLDYCKGRVVFSHTSDVKQISVSDYAREIVYFIGKANLNALKRVPGLADNVETTYFSSDHSIGNDTNGNPLVRTGFDDAAGIQATSYSSDKTPPKLSTWGYDCAVGAVSLIFDEPVDPDYFNYTSFRIISSLGSNVEVVKVDDEKADLFNKQKTLDEKLTIQFSPEKLERILNAPILTGFDDSYLILDYNAVTDTSVEQNMYLGLDATSAIPMRVGLYAPDTVAPQLFSATLNMTSETLKMQFTKIMRLASFELTEMSFQSQSTSNNAEVLSFSSSKATMITTIDSKVVELKLSSSMFATMKLYSYLGHSKANTYLFLTPKFATDKSFMSNKILEITAIAAFKINTYIPDYRKPYISTWYADMGNDRIIITFSEPVDISRGAIDLTSITLLDDVIQTLASVSWTLSSDSVVFDTIGTTIYIQMSPYDASGIKKKVPLCLSRERCYLSHSSKLARDIVTYDSNNEAVRNQIAAASFIKSSEKFIEDRLPPTLVHYTAFLNLDSSAVLQLTFSEPVKCQNLDPAGITLYSALTDPRTSIKLSASSYTPSPNDYYMEVILSSYDYNRMKVAGIGAKANAFFIKISPNALTDIGGNPVDGVRAGLSGVKPEYLAPESLYGDDLPPSLIAISIDPTRTNLTLHFNDAVKGTKSTLDLGHVILYSLSTGNKMALSTVTIASRSPTASVVLLLTPMQSQISKLGLLGTQEDSNIFIDKTGSVIDSPEGNEIVRMSISQGVRLGQTFLSFKLDLSRGLFYITTAYDFDVASTWDPTVIKMVSYEADIRIPFSVDDTYNKKSNDTILITASTATLNKLKDAITFSSKDAIYMAVGQKAFVDSKGFDMQKPKNIPCVQLLSDTIVPTLKTFDVDLGQGIITLAFSKVVQAALVNLAFARLQGSITPSGTATVITLGDGKVLTTGNSLIITISLNEGNYPTLRDTLNVATDLAGSSANTFLSITKGFIGDTAVPPNYLEPVIRQADSLIVDKIQPKLKEWSLDLNTRVLRVTYSEAVIPSTNIPASYLLLNDPAVVSVNELYLTTSTTDLTVIGNTVVINLSLTDLNNMFRMTPHLCTRSGIVLDGGNCFLAIRQNAISDIKGNLIAAVAHIFATLPPANFVVDRFAPVLTSFTFSIQESKADFYFDKVVDCTTVDMTKLILQYNSFLGVCSTCEYYIMRSSAPDCATTRYDTHFHLDISLADLVGIKAFNRLFKSINYAYIRPKDGFVKDTFENNLMEVQDGSGLQALTFAPDTVKPILISFTISSSKDLHLYFSEPVQTNVMDVTKLMFMDKLWPTTYRSWNLAATVLKSASPSRMELVLSLGADYGMMADNSDIFNIQYKTLLVMPSTFITDTSGNSIVPISNSTALEYGPSLLTWDLDLVSRKLSLSFPEAMTYPFSPKGISIQDSYKATASTKSVALTTLTNFTSANNASDTNFEVLLSADDINAIKFYSVAANWNSSFITAPFGLSKSTYVGTLLPNLRSVERASANALHVRFLTADTVPPVITSFQLNLNDGKMLIFSDEPVLTSSFVMTGFTIVSAEGSFAVLTTPSSIGIAIHNLTTIVIKLCRADLNQVKTASLVGRLINLIVNPGSLMDYSLNRFPGNTQDTPIIGAIPIADSTPPVLINATLHLGYGTLTLLFDELVIISSVSPLNCYIGSTNNFATAVKLPLTSATTVEESADGAVVFNLKTFETDYLSLLALNTIGTSTTNTFIFIHHVKDRFQNPLAAQAVIQASSVIPDPTPVMLQAFDYVKQASSSFTLYFNKEVTLSTFDCSDFTLIDSPVASPANSLKLNNNLCTLATTSSTGAARIVAFTTTETISSVCNTVSSCYILVAATGHTRASVGVNNFLAPITSIQALRQGAQLYNALMDMNTGTLTLIFTRSVDFSTFHPTKLGFYSAVTKKTMFLSSTIQTGLLPTSLVLATTTVDNKGLVVLNTADLNNLKALDVQPNKLFITTVESSGVGFIEDSSHVSLAPSELDTVTGRNTFLFVSKITMDSVAPEIISIVTSIGENSVDILFNEPMRSSTLQLTNLVFQSNSTSTKNSYKLTGGYAISNGNALNITLSTEDSENIKLREKLFKSIETTFLSFAFKTVADFAGNSVGTIQTAAAKALTRYIPDTVPPSLQSFELDMTSEILTLTFSEPVRASSITMSSLVMQNRLHSKDGTWFNVTGGGILTPDSSVIAVQLTPSDVYSIKNTIGLARSIASTYIRFSDTFCVDIAGNRIIPIVDRRPQLVTKFTFDTILPTVTHIDVDVNNEKIYVHCSELVQIQLVSVRGLTIYSESSLTSPTVKKYTLTTASSSVERAALYSKTIQVNLGQRDIDTIKYRFPMLQSRDSTFFTVTDTFAQDTFFNPLIPVTAPLQVASLARDITPPLVLNYGLDMQLGIIQLKFSESVVASTVDLSQFILQTNSLRRFGVFLPIADSVATIGADAASNMVNMQLSVTTLIKMKHMGIGKTPQAGLLSWSDKAVRDQFGNYLPPKWDASIAGYAPMQTTSFFPDSTGPVLLRWQIDRSEMRAYLYFDEPVAITNTSFLSLHTSESGANPQSLKHGIGSVINGTNNMIIILVLQDFCAWPQLGANCSPATKSNPSGPEKSFFKSLLLAHTDKTKRFFLSATIGAFNDFASVPNAITEIEPSMPLKEGTPGSSLQLFTISSQPHLTFLSCALIVLRLFQLPLRIIHIEAVHSCE